MTQEIKPEMKPTPSPNDCGKCGKPRPCKCSAAAGGGADDDENKKDKTAVGEKDADTSNHDFIKDTKIANILKDEETTTLFQKNDNTFKITARPEPTLVTESDNDAEKKDPQNKRPTWCTLFAVTANTQNPTASSDLQQDDTINNTPSMRMGMSNQ